MLEELAAISIPELRRRVDRAIAQIRQMRSALAVKAGMTLENAPIPTIPTLDTDADRVALEQIMASLPLLRKPLTPEQRARMQPISEAQNEKMKAVVDEIIANEEAFKQLMEGDEQPVPFAKIIELRESFDKTEMIGEFERELMAYTEELRAFQDALEKQLEADIETVTSKHGPSN
jgi:hypothetical protein